jgi:hypothetical protein
MIDQAQMVRRAATQALVIQFSALFLASTVMDAGTTADACLLAGLLFWACWVSLMLCHRGKPSRLDLLFLRWGMLAFVFLGTPVLMPIVASAEAALHATMFTPVDE